MAIIEVSDTLVVQRCAKCNNENLTPLSNLEVGVERETHADPRIIPLPVCPKCHSSEFLIRSADDEAAHRAPGGFGHLHRMLVDQLHAQLVSAGQVKASIKDKVVARPVPSADLGHWFPNGLKIDLALKSPKDKSPPEGPQAKK